jgi:hypothetical protein
VRIADEPLRTAPRKTRKNSENKFSPFQLKICDVIEDLEAHQQRSRIAVGRWIGELNGGGKIDVGGKEKSKKFEVR